MKNTPLKIAFYAINGTGVGHLSRLVAIADQIKHLLGALNLKHQINFITTSNAPQIAADYPVYKFPSKTTINQHKIGIQRFTSDMRILITNLLTQMRPHILVLDTVPQGSFNEFVFLKDLANFTVFIDRHKNPQFQQTQTHLTHLNLYDQIIIPDVIQNKALYPAPPRHQSQQAFVGKISNFNPQQAMTADQLKSHFGIDKDKTVIYISAGGGGDHLASQNISTLIQTLAQNPNHHLLVGYGPLYAGSLQYAPNITPLTEPHISRYFSGVDLAFSAAGYNSYEELLNAKTPTAFFAQDKGMDQQQERISKGLKQNHHLQLTDFSPQTIHQTLEKLQDIDTLNQILGSLEKRTPARGAILGAHHTLLTLCNLKTPPFTSQHLTQATSIRLAHHAQNAQPNLPTPLETHCLLHTLLDLTATPLQKESLLQADLHQESPPHLKQLIAHANLFHQTATTLHWTHKQLTSLIKRILKTSAPSTTYDQKLSTILTYCNLILDHQTPDLGDKLIDELESPSKTVANQNILSLLNPNHPQAATT